MKVRVGIDGNGIEGLGRTWLELMTLGSVFPQSKIQCLCGDGGGQRLGKAIFCCRPPVILSAITSRCRKHPSLQVEQSYTCLVRKSTRTSLSLSPTQRGRAGGNILTGCTALRPQESQAGLPLSLKEIGRFGCWFL